MDVFAFLQATNVFTENVLFMLNHFLIRKELASLTVARYVHLFVCLFINYIFILLYWGPVSRHILRNVILFVTFTIIIIIIIINNNNNNSINITI